MKLLKIGKYLRRHGLHGTAAILLDKLQKHDQETVSYSDWQGYNRTTSHAYGKMEKKQWDRQPQIGIVVQAEGVDRVNLLQSVTLQIYKNYHLDPECQDAEYMLFTGPGCTIVPELLWRCVELINMSSTNIDLIYFDSDIIDDAGYKVDPSFRPAYDPDLLNEINYMGSVILVRTEAAMAAGLPGADPDSFHAFLKRVCANASVSGPGDPDGAVRHIPRVLYHELYRDAVRVARQLKEEAEEEEEELISVLIPNKDHTEDLKACIRSLQETNTWRSMEILIIENNSEEPETSDCYRTLAEGDRRIRVLQYDKPFNYSAINNFAAREAKGKYLLFLNNDTVILKGNTLRNLVQAVRRPEVGAAGALLLYPNRTVQHAGIILGHGGIAGHAYLGEAMDNNLGFFPNLVFRHTHNVCAVTGACMMMQKEVFDQVHGFDENLEVTFNDVDLCMRLRSEGFRILICPEAELIHNESVSRGAEDSEEKVARFHREIGYFARRWEPALAEGDPFYNPNLTLTGRTFTCRSMREETRKPYLKYLDME